MHLFLTPFLVSMPITITPPVRPTTTMATTTAIPTPKSISSSSIRREAEIITLIDQSAMTDVDVLARAILPHKGDGKHTQDLKSKL